MTTLQNLADDIRYGLDINAWALERVGFRADEWQSRVLQPTALQLILNCSRQSGKSTICALKATHTAIYNAGSLTLLISKGLRQSQEIFAKVSATLRRLNIKRKTDNKSSCELMNGSRIISLPGNSNTIRGYSPNLVIFDESAFVPDDVYNSVRPMLAVTRGQLFLISTPNGKKGHFYNEWEFGGPSWHREMITADQCGRISAEFLESEKIKRGLWYRQEYFCSFEDASGALFSHELIQQMFSVQFPVLQWQVIT